MAAPRAIQNVVLGVAIVAELVILAGHPLFGWGPSPHRVAATPPPLTTRAAFPPSARSVLLELAAAADEQAGRSTPARGEWAYVSLRTWQLADQRVAGRRPRRPLTRSVVTWRSARTPGRALVVVHTGRGIVTTTRTLPAGLPSAGLQPGASTATAVTHFADLAAAKPIAPATEARVLRALAGDAGLVNAGLVRDRAGRAGLAISFTGPALGTQVRDTLVLDARTGALLEFDETLAGEPHRLNVGPGAVLAYTLYLRSGQVTAIGHVPAP